MATVLITPEAAKQADELQPTIYARVLEIVERLEKWPAVSGAKSLSGNLAGQYRIRTGDYRVQFTVAGDVVTINKVGHRDGFYDE